MAEKKVPLSIVLRTVDQATAKIKAINERLDQVMKPTNDFKKALGELREKSGLDTVSEGFHGVGEAVGEMLMKVAEIGLVVGEAVHIMLELVDSFDELGKKAQRIGVTADFLAGMRDAAERTGVSVDQLDGGMQTFTENLGKAQAGQGKLAKFLGRVNPALLQQLTHAKSNTEAFNDLADAMAKENDVERRLAIAKAAVGDSALAPLLAKGSKGIKELTDHYAKLAGSQQGAVDAATETHDAMLDLKASTDGVKASLVEGLAPALTMIIGQITEWLQGHRADIKAWAADIGEKIPGAFHAVVDAVKSAIDWVTGFIDSIGGWKTAAIGVAAIMAGPLVGAVAALGAALLTTPLGWVILSVTTLIGLFKELRDHFGTLTAVIGTAAAALAGLFAVKKVFAFVDGIKSATKALGGLGEAEAAAAAAGQGGAGGGLFGVVKSAALPVAAGVGIAKAIDSITGFDASKSYNPQNIMAGIQSQFTDPFGQNRPSVSDLVQSTIAKGTAPETSAKITVDFANAPKGTRVTTAPGSTADVDISTGYQMGFAQ